MEEMSEQERAAHQAIAEITADMGVPFTLTALASACESAARTETGAHAEYLQETAAFLRRLSSLDEN